MVKIIARISARADTAPQVRDILNALVPPSRAEAGCLGYNLFEDDERPQDFITVESWRDEAAADGHLSTSHVARAIEQAASLLAQPPVIHRFTQLA